MGISTNSQHKLNKMTRLELAAKHERIQVSRASRTRPRNGKNYRLRKRKETQDRYRVGVVSVLKENHAEIKTAKESPRGLAN